MNIAVKRPRDIYKEGDIIRELGITVACENTVHHVAGMQEEHDAMEFNDF